MSFFVMPFYGEAMHMRNMGMSFFIMPSHMMPLRAASNHAHGQLVLVFHSLCLCAPV